MFAEVAEMVNVQWDGYFECENVLVIQMTYIDQELKSSSEMKSNKKWLWSVSSIGGLRDRGRGGNDQRTVGRLLWERNHVGHSRDDFEYLTEACYMYIAAGQ